MEETERRQDSYSDTSTTCAVSSSDVDSRRFPDVPKQKPTKVKRSLTQKLGVKLSRRIPGTVSGECKRGRSSSGDGTPDRLHSKHVKRKKTLETSTSESKNKKRDESSKVKSRLKVQTSSDRKSESKVGKSESKTENKGDKIGLSKRSCRRPAHGARPTSSLAETIIRVKVTPSSSHQMSLHRTIDDRGKGHGSVDAGGSAKSCESAVQRRPRRRKRKAKKDAECASSEGAMTKPTANTAFAASVATAGSMVAVGATPGRTSPLHCAFLNALKECSPRLIAALSATNEAAFLNAMWSCFWRGYRAGFQASVRELETTSANSLTNNCAACALTAVLDAAPRVALSERRRTAVKVPSETLDNRTGTNNVAGVSSTVGIGGIINGVAGSKSSLTQHSGPGTEHH